ncbi:hypothetical protein K443DRAFT_681201, partial [Laccaria amethystina LaAM-08-1]
MGKLSACETTGFLVGSTALEAGQKKYGNDGFGTLPQSSDVNLRRGWKRVPNT